MLLQMVNQMTLKLDFRREAMKWVEEKLPVYQLVKCRFVNPMFLF